jgi:type VI secretion system Hcp family effector
MANRDYLTITGKAQGRISAGRSAQDSIGKKCQPLHTEEITYVDMKIQARQR